MSKFVINPFTGQFDDTGSGGGGSGDVVGPASSVSGDIVIFADTSGKLLADSGRSVTTDGTFAANSDALIPTQKAIKTYVDNSPSGTVTSVSGTADRITSTGGATPIIDIAATYVGQTSITTLGNIATGTWSSALAATSGSINNVTVGAVTPNTGAFTTINGTTSGLTLQTLESTDAGATSGPIVDLYRNSASPAASDFIGQIQFNGKDAGGAKQLYGSITGQILVATAGSESSSLTLATFQSGSSSNQIIMLNTGCQIRGNAASAVPAAGFIGQRITTSVAAGSAISVPSGTFVTIGSILLTPGTWDISFICRFTGGAITGTYILAGIATATNSSTGWIDGVNNSCSPTMPTAIIDNQLSLPFHRVSISSNTTYYLTASAAYTVGAVSAYGTISGLRPA